MSGSGPEVLVLRDVEVDGRRVDVRVAGGRVETMGAGLPKRGARVVEGRGGALLPGLHDHHVHLLATAAARASVDVGPRAVDGPAGLARALRAAAARSAPGAWVRAVGYHESVAGDLDRWALDDLVPDRPVRAQHRSGALWVLNSAALDLIGPIPPDVARRAEPESDADPVTGPAVGVAPPVEAGPAADAEAGAAVGQAGRDRAPHRSAGVGAGRFFRADDWLSGRWPPIEADVAALGRDLRDWGVTGVTDATPFASLSGPERLADAVASGELPLRVTVTGGPPLAGLPAPPGLGLGPVKLVLADHALPGLDEVVARVRAAHGCRRPVAVHCVTAEALVVTLAALREAGTAPGDRVEHAAVVPDPLVADLADAGVTVVTQPSLVAERGDDYLREVDPAEQPGLWRCASLIAAGISVAAGSDAPYGDPDPWRSVTAAVDRRTTSGAPFGLGEALRPQGALALFLGPAESPGGPCRRVRPGVVADLCLLRVPLAEALRRPSREAVRLTLVGGR